MNCSNSHSQQTKSALVATLLILTTWLSACYAEPESASPTISNAALKVASLIDDKPEPMVVTVIGSQTTEDPRHAYEIELVHLLLDKTVEDFGQYTSKVSPQMGHLRAIKSLQSNIYPNFIRTLGYVDELREDGELVAIEYPVYRGLLGYRTCFVSSNNKSRFAAAKTRLDLLGFSHVYSQGWADISIMKRGGIPVKTSASYEGMFRMVAENRVDLFCRGANEIYSEFKLNKDVANLDYDRSKAFYYSFPHFFFANKANAKLIERLNAGFEKVIADGSWFELWHRYFDESIEFVNLDARQIFYFDNPYILNLSDHYLEHIYWPKNFDRDQLRQPDIE